MLSSASEHFSELFSLPEELILILSVFTKCIHSSDFIQMLISLCLICSRNHSVVSSGISFQFGKLVCFIETIAAKIQVTCGNTMLKKTLYKSVVFFVVCTHTYTHAHTKHMVIFDAIG